VNNKRNNLRSTSLDDQALAFLASSGAASVQKLYDALRIKSPSLTEAEVTEVVWRLAEQGKADLRDSPPPTKSLREYLGFWERNLWFYLSLTVSFVTVAVIYSVPEVIPFIAARWILGSMFVFFIPGYVTVEALFPKGRELSGIERLALSIGLSLALVPLIGLLLNYTPWGIRLTPIVISLTIFTVAVSAAGLGRQFQLSVESAEVEQLMNTKETNL